MNQLKSFNRGSLGIFVGIVVDVGGQFEDSTACNRDETGMKWV